MDLGQRFMWNTFNPQFTIGADFQDRILGVIFKRT